jgi:sarcosine oxidase subunit beta
MPTTFDAIVVGAGIMGSSSAYQLARRGLHVALIDKETVGHGPTSHSAAIIHQHASNELVARMALHGLGVFRNFEEQIGGECGFTETSFVLLVQESERNGLKADLALQQGLGIATELLSPQDLRELLPAFDTAGLVAAYQSESGYADPYLTVNAYAQAARLRGVTIYPNTEVTGIRFRDDTIVGVETAQGKLDAPLVLNTAGAWAARVAHLAGVELPVAACRVQVAYFRRPRGQEAAHPIVDDPGNALYLRPQEGQLTLVGQTGRDEHQTSADPDDYNQLVDPDFVLDVRQRLIRRFPAMDRSENIGGYASLYSVTPDWCPIVDEVPSGSGFYVCAGFSGYGFKLGPAVGLMVADMVTGQPDPHFDPHPFHISRFREGGPPDTTASAPLGESL